MRDTKHKPATSPGFDGDWDGVLMGKGCPPPKSSAPVRPIRINFTDEEIAERLKHRGARIGY